MMTARRFIREGVFLGVSFVLATLSMRAQSPDEFTFSLSPGDVTEAWVGTAGLVRLQVALTPEKSAELSDLTGRNLNKQIKIVICGKTRSEPFVRERIAGPSMEVFVSSPEDAIATVKCLLTSTVGFDQLHKWTDSNGQTHYSDKPPSRSADQRPVIKPFADVPSTFQELQGSWGVTHATKNGLDAGDASLLGANWTFKRNELILQSPQKGKARFALNMDAKAGVKAIHLTAVEPADERSGWMLFSRQGQSLKIAFFDNLQGRPESFEPSEPRAKPALIVVTLLPNK
jgi:uncharacterized protein (TIGR03067 family)